MSFILKPPNKKCGKCRFFNMDERGGAFCDLYDTSWYVAEDECEEADRVKPKWCLVTLITVKEENDEN